MAIGALLYIGTGHISTEDIQFSDRVKSAVYWRSGTQILSQIISWGVTLAILRILDPGDYGLFAMSSVILVFLNFLNGYGFASSLIQSEKVEPMQIRQAFGMLLLLNGALALIQLFIAPVLAVQYYQEPIVGEMIKWQALIYLSTPFMVIPEALMSRNLEFKKPAIINLLSAIVGAAAALYMALNDWGVWTLVFAPIAIFWTRAIALTFATKFFIWPSFNFRGAGAMFGFGTTLLVSHGFWIVQSQSDIFIAGRFLSKHDLGLYAEALFLTSIFAAKFVPPLNEVAFPAYARLQHDKAALAAGFLKAAKLILFIACPLYIGMAATAEPFVTVIMGNKWIEGIPFVQILALSMPFMTLQIIFTPALNAVGKPNLTARNSMFGAVLMPITFLIGIQYGAIGLAWGWLIAFPILLAFTFYNAKDVIGITLRGLLDATWPAICASVAMAGMVLLADKYGGAAIMQSNLMIYKYEMDIYVRFVFLIAVGAATYFALLWYFSRDTLQEIITLVVKRKVPIEEAADANGPSNDNKDLGIEAQT